MRHTFILAAGVILVFTLVNRAAVAGNTNFCQLTSQTALQSCQSGAQSDFQLALGKCDNLSDSAARSDCRKQASADKKDALKTCKDEFNVRQTACQKLGPAPYDPVIDPANFPNSTTIDNSFFPLTPGTTFIYEGQTAQGFEHDEFAVTHNTRVILGVTCVEVHDTVKVNGELTEDTLDWFAQDKDGNVWYFGENTHELVDGLITTIDGTFTGGENGAKPGLIQEAHPAIGDFYRQEFDLGNAEDFAEVTSLTASVTVPFGSLKNCQKTKETTPLEPDLLESKFNCPRVTGFPGGNVLTVDEVTNEKRELIQITTE